MKKVDDFQKLVRDELKANKLVSPFIHDIHETVDKLLSGKQSFVRYGDGEFRLMTENVDHVFQMHNSSLSERLKEILVSKDDRGWCAQSLFLQGQANSEIHRGLLLERPASEVHQVQVHGLSRQDEGILFMRG